MLKKILGFLPIFLVLIAFPNVIKAAEINVDGDINTAINNAKDGDVLVLSAKTYTGDVNVNKSITIKGAGKNSTIIDGHLNVTKDVVIEDLTISDDGTTQVSATGYGIILNSKANVTVNNSIIKYSKYTEQLW